MTSTMIPLPAAPKTASPVPHLTSIHSKLERGHWGSPRYPGNCGGAIIHDLLRYFQPKRVFDPMTGSGTCTDVCAELGIPCTSTDIRDGFDCANPEHTKIVGKFDFVWIHPPYWRQKVYSDDPNDLSTCGSLETFLTRLHAVLKNCSDALANGGHLAVLIGDYSDRKHGFVPLTFYTKRLCFDLGLKQNCTDIIRFQHGNSSSHRTYTSKFIPGLHDVCLVVQKPNSFPSHSHD